ncbi:unnamed protein product [Euphydryas editha]|uniref:Peptidase S1 domain-containing protein n=1 Tax=Euphydryas editha TaxID=104508 RepID=A0AAU9UQX3_EUPED|nr:unnamed protein product [Euphydryas editha]
MKLLIVFVGLALAVTAEDPIFADYHLEIGIPEMKRRTAAEAAMDFDGSRILGGTGVGIRDYPHMAGLRIQLSDGQLSVCGASLISNTRLVTAAHCWRSRYFTATMFTVILGARSFSQGFARINTNDVVLHPNFNAVNLHNDVAVIRVPPNNRIPYLNFILPIELDTGSSKHVGVVATAVGYGRTYDIGPTSNELRQVDVPVIDNAECDRVYPGGYIIDSTLCTSTRYGRGICNGDSGGPLTIRRNSNDSQNANDNLLIGITSFSSARGCSYGPSGYSRVSSFASWITAQ